MTSSLVCSIREDVRFEHGCAGIPAAAVVEHKQALGVLGDEFGGGGAVNDDGREDTVRPAAYTVVDVGAHLGGHDVRVRPLGCQNEVEAEAAPLTGHEGEDRAGLVDLLLLLLALPGLVQHHGDLVTSKRSAVELCFGEHGVVLVNVGAVGIPQKRLAAVQLILPFSQSFQRCVHIIAHAAVLPEPRFEVHAAFEVSDIHPCSLINGLPEQHLEQYCLA